MAVSYANEQTHLLVNRRRSSGSNEQFTTRLCKRVNLTRDTHTSENTKLAHMRRPCTRNRVHGSWSFPRATRLRPQHASERRRPHPKFVPFTSGLVTPSTPSNLPRVRGFACCPVRLNWSGSAPELRGLGADGLGEARGISSDRWTTAGDGEAWNVDFSFWCRHCCAALKSLSAEHRQRCGGHGGGWGWSAHMWTKQVYSLNEWPHGCRPAVVSSVGCLREARLISKVL